jgi:hypothetical protein
MRNKMGLNTTMEINLMDLTLEDKVGMHLRGNLYPPVPLSMVQPCVDAINAYWNEDYLAEIPLPDGVQWRGYNVAPAAAIIEAHRLDGFVMEDNWEDEVLEEWEDE